MPGGLRPRTLPLGHESSPPTILNLCERSGQKQFASLKLESQSAFRTRFLRLSKQVALTTAPCRAPVITCTVCLSEKRHNRWLISILTAHIIIYLCHRFVSVLNYIFPKKSIFIVHRLVCFPDITAPPRHLTNTRWTSRILWGVGLYLIRQKIWWRKSQYLIILSDNSNMFISLSLSILIPYTRTRRRDNMWYNAKISNSYGYGLLLRY